MGLVIFVFSHQNTCQHLKIQLAAFFLIGLFAELIGICGILLFGRNSERLVDHCRRSVFTVYFPHLIFEIVEAAGGLIAANNTSTAHQHGAEHFIKTRFVIMGIHIAQLVTKRFMYFFYGKREGYDLIDGNDIFPNIAADGLDCRVVNILPGISRKIFGQTCENQLDDHR